MNMERIAAICQEANRQLCLQQGDQSQPTWEAAPEWQRDNVLAGVLLHRNNPGTSPEESHEAWSAHKLAEGWVYGDEKNPERRTHPCLLPYEQLPAEQRAKDHLFKAICLALIPFIEAPAAAGEWKR